MILINERTPGSSRRHSRRAVLVAIATATATLTGCRSSEQTTPAAQTRDPLPSRGSLAADFRALEERYDTRLGVYAHDTGTGYLVEYRAEERFAYCSVYKALAAAFVLASHPLSALDTRIRFTTEDLVSYSPVTEQRLESGMTLREVCEAAVRESDNTAGNLLLRECGSPKGLEKFLRSNGDDATIMERFETELNSAVPGEVRDTSTPRALGETLRHFTVGNAMPSEKRALLTSWLTGNTTGDELIRAGLPHKWTSVDKSGAGDYGTRNDLGVAFPPDREPIVIAILTSRATQDASYNNALIAEATRLVIKTHP